MVGGEGRKYEVGEKILAGRVLREGQYDVVRKRLRLENSCLPATNHHGISASTTNKIKKWNLSQLPVCPTQCAQHLETCITYQANMSIMFSSLIFAKILAFYTSIFFIVATRIFGDIVRQINMAKQAVKPKCSYLDEKRRWEHHTHTGLIRIERLEVMCALGIGLVMRAIGKDLIFQTH